MRASDVTVTQSAMSPQLHRQVLFVHTSVGFCSEATAEEGPLPSRPVADVGPALYRLFDALVWLRATLISHVWSQDVDGPETRYLYIHARIL